MDLPCMLPLKVFLFVYSLSCIQGEWGGLGGNLTACVINPRISGWDGSGEIPIARQLTGKDQQQGLLVMKRTAPFLPSYFKPRKHTQRKSYREFPQLISTNQQWGVIFVCCHRFYGQLLGRFCYWRANSADSHCYEKMEKRTVSSVLVTRNTFTIKTTFTWADTL